MRFTAATMLRKCQEELYEQCFALWRMNSESFDEKLPIFQSQVTKLEKKKIFENETISSLCCQSAHPLQIFARMSPVSENSQKIQYQKLVRHKKISPGPCTKKKISKKCLWSSKNMWLMYIKLERKTLVRKSFKSWAISKHFNSNSILIIADSFELFYSD